MKNIASQVSNVDEHVDERSTRVPTDGCGSVRRAPTDGCGSVRRVPTDGCGSVR